MKLLIEKDLKEKTHLRCLITFHLINKMIGYNNKFNNK